MENARERVLPMWKRLSGAREAAADLLSDAAGSLLLSVGIYCFIEQADIAPGGVSGIAVMLKYLLGLPVGTMILLLNIPLLMLSWRYMGRRMTGKTLRTLLVNSIVLDGIVTPFFPVYAGDRMLASIFGGLCAGAGLAIVFLRGSTTAGTDIICHLLARKYPHIPIGRMILLTDCLVIGLSVAVYGNLEAGLFGVVALFCQTRVIDGLVYGRDKGRTVMVMSRKNPEIARRVLTELRHGATFLEGRGAYTGESLPILYVVVRIPEFTYLKRIVYEEDPKAFLVVAEASQIVGEGFSREGGR